MFWKRLLMLMFFCNLFPFYVLAQRVQPGLGIEAGVGKGHSGLGPQARVNGFVNRQNLFGGVGVGYDYNRIESIQTLLTAGSYFTSNKMKPFIYASGGLSFPTSRTPQITRGFRVFEDTRIQTGLFGEIAAGYHFRGNKGRGFQVTLAQSIKTSTEKTKQQLYNPETTLYEDTNAIIRYRMQQFSIRLGYRL